MYCIILYYIILYCIILYYVIFTYSKQFVLVWNCEIEPPNGNFLIGKMIAQYRAPCFQANPYFGNFWGPEYCPPSFMLGQLLIFPIGAGEVLTWVCLEDHSTSGLLKQSALGSLMIQHQTMNRARRIPTLLSGVNRGHLVVKLQLTSLFPEKRIG